MGSLTTNVDNLKNSFFLTRDDVDANKSDINSLRSDIEEVAATNDALQARIDTVAKYLALDVADINVSIGVTQDPPDDQLQELFDEFVSAIIFTGDPELIEAWNNFAEAPETDDDDEFIAFLTIWGDKLTEALSQ